MDNVVMAEDIDRRGRPAQGLRHLGHGGDFDIGQLFDGEAGNVGLGHLLGMCRGRPEGKRQPGPYATPNESLSHPASP